MNLWVLFLCRFFLESRVKKYKIAAAALFMALGEVILLCVPWKSSGMKILFGFGGITALTVFWLFRPQTKKYFGKLLVCCYTAVFTLGGLLLLLENVIGRKRISMASWGTMVVFLVFVIEKAYLKISQKSSFYPVVLTIAGKEQCRLTALVDTGNGLAEPISRSPVSIVEKQAIEPYKEILREEKFRWIPFHSIGKDTGMLEAYFIEKMEVKKDGEPIVIQQPMIAISQEKISANGKYQMILHPALLKQGGINGDF